MDDDDSGKNAGEAHNDDSSKNAGVAEEEEDSDNAGVTEEEDSDVEDNDIKAEMTQKYGARRCNHDLMWPRKLCD